MELLTLLVATLMVVDCANGLSVESKEWNSYKSKYGKTYLNKRQESIRRYIFAQNKKLVDTFNAQQDGSSYTLELNHLADLSKAEMQKRNGLRYSPEAVKNTIEAEKFLQSIYDSDAPIPDQVDWRKVPGRVSEVKDQGACGSCWAFAATGVLEGQEKYHGAKHGNLSSLSEQNLVDCVISNGCMGWFSSDALDYVQRAGVEDEKSYPYEAKEGNCRFNKTKSVMSDKGHATLPKGDEQKLKEMVAKFGPVAVGMDAAGDKFRLYKSGVYYNADCLAVIQNHAVLVVGYGSDPEQGDYWIVKNSWSANWGEKGYFRMARNKNNNCGLATNAIIPIF